MIAHNKQCPNHTHRCVSATAVSGIFSGAKRNDVFGEWPKGEYGVAYKIWRVVTLGAISLQYTVSARARESKTSL